VLSKLSQLGAAAVLGLGALWSAVAAPAAELTALVDASTQMPVADIRDGRLRGGMQLELGEALAAQMGRSAQFKILPRKRITQQLEAGAADLICFFLPGWLPGPFDWSDAFMPNAELLVTTRQAPRPDSPAAVSGQPIATVLGFVYPEMEQALGAQFVRDDAPSMESSWRKLVAGRVQHGIFPKLFVEYKLREGELPPEDFHPFLALQTYPLRCAVSRHGQVTLAEVNKAIAGLVARHEIERILDRYRPAAPAAR
jgi:ABC-type amino acid transport substrate-binding protein